MMRSCKEVSRLASERMDRKLSLRERIAFNVHVMMCRNCLRYAQQLAVLQKATDKLRSRPHATDVEHLSDAARERIARKLAEELRKQPRD